MEDTVADRDGRPNYVVDDDPARVDRDVVWRFLSTQAYWGRWRTRDDVDQQVNNAWRVVAAYTSDVGEMVGFARTVSDGIAFAYLADLFVLNDHRGHGLSKKLLTAMIDHGPGAGFRWLLHTADAHTLYARYGFHDPDQTLLERPADPGRRSNTS